MLRTRVAHSQQVNSTPTVKRHAAAFNNPARQLHLLLVAPHGVARSGAQVWHVCRPHFGRQRGRVRVVGVVVAAAHRPGGALRGWAGLAVTAVFNHPCIIAPVLQPCYCACANPGEDAEGATEACQQLGATSANNSRSAWKQVRSYVRVMASLVVAGMSVQCTGSGISDSRCGQHRSAQIRVNIRHR